VKPIHRIFIFGDSWMEGQGTFEEETHTEWNDVYPYSSTGQVGSIGWKRKEESWKAFFKETYGEVEVINYALQGCSNYEQFEYLNKNLKDFKNTDLILFGFTSKQRDTSKAINYPFDAQKNSFTKGDLFEKYFYSAVYDDIVYEKIAQTNYLYYQTYAKENNLNILFFDLFESYVNIDNCSKSLISLIDENMYINFGKVNYLNKLIKYEVNNYDNKNTITIWELGNTFPSVGDDVHPNQFGYKLIFKDIISYIDKKYIITQKEN